MLADRSHLPFEWMEGDDDAACFAALRALPRADKEKLFAAAVARTVKGQLAFEHDARPELEATIARLDIDFAKHVRPTADMLWSRVRKDRILDVARQTLGTTWASARSKYKKADLAKAMEEAFAAGTPPVGIGATAHAAGAGLDHAGIRGVRCGRCRRRHGDGTGAPRQPPGNPGRIPGMPRPAPPMLPPPRKRTAPRPRKALPRATAMTRPRLQRARLARSR